MAKRRTKSKPKSSRAIVVRSAAAKPIVIRQSAPVAKRSAPRRRGRVGGHSGIGALLSNERTGAMVGAALLGLLDKQGTALPTIPILGRAGTAGLVLWYLGKSNHSPQIQHAATGCLSIAAYELTKQGKIEGVDGIATV